VAPVQEAAASRLWRQHTPENFSAAATALRKASTAHWAVSGGHRKLRFNRCVAYIYEFTNVLQATLADAWVWNFPRPIWPLIWLGCPRSSRNSGATVPAHYAPSR
jgi:hypothetical protein